METETWSIADSLTDQRMGHEAVLLLDGSVFVVGGFRNGGAIASAEIYDPANDTWNTAGALTSARYSHSATLLQSGKVLIVGGAWLDSYYLASSQVYDPQRGLWSDTGSLVIARSNHTATLLLDGHVLVAGGYDGSPGLSAERYDTDLFYLPLIQLN